MAPSDNGFTLDAAGFTPEFAPRLANWSVQATLEGTGAVTAALSVQVSNDGVGFVEIAGIDLSDTDLATNIITVQGAYRLVKVEVEAITGTDAECAISIHELKS
jgi:hypothetical protein